MRKGVSPRSCTVSYNSVDGTNRAENANWRRRADVARQAPGVLYMFPIRQRSRWLPLASIQNQESQNVTKDSRHNGVRRCTSRRTYWTFSTRRQHDKKASREKMLGINIRSVSPASEKAAWECSTTRSFPAVCVNIYAQGVRTRQYTINTDTILLCYLSHIHAHSAYATPGTYMIVADKSAVLLLRQPSTTNKRGSTHLSQMPLTIGRHARYRFVRRGQRRGS